MFPNSLPFKSVCPIGLLCVLALVLPTCLDLPLEGVPAVLEQGVDGLGLVRDGQVHQGLHLLRLGAEQSNTAFTTCYI